MVMREGYLLKHPSRLSNLRSPPNLMKEASSSLGRKRRRFFVLRTTSLEWRKDEHSPVKGTLPIRHTTNVVEEGQEKGATSVIVSTEGKSLRLCLEAGQDASVLDEWAVAIRAQVLARSQQPSSVNEDTPGGPVRWAETRKQVGHTMLSALGFSDTHRIQCLIHVSHERRFDVDVNLLRYLIGKAWARRRKNEAQLNATALRTRCAPAAPNAQTGMLQSFHASRATAVQPPCNHMKRQVRLG